VCRFTRAEAPIHAPLSVAARIELLARAHAAVASVPVRRSNEPAPSQLLTPEQQRVLRQLGQSLT
jgi:hypothetical protein